LVADAGDDRIGRWADERIDLARVYATIWRDAAPARLVDIAVFCDSDDTHTSSVSYFAYVRLERRGGRARYIVKTSRVVSGSPPTSSRCSRVDLWVDRPLSPYLFEFNE
jgi:hypothetical protein